MLKFLVVIVNDRSLNHKNVCDDNDEFLKWLYEDVYVNAMEHT